MVKTRITLECYVELAPYNTEVGEHARKNYVPQGTKRSDDECGPPQQAHG